MPIRRGSDQADVDRGARVDRPLAARVERATRRQERQGAAGRRRDRSGSCATSGRRSSGTPVPAPRCRDAAGRRRPASLGPSSTIRPAYITANRSQVEVSTDRSWVMNSSAKPLSRCSSASSSSTWACTITSSAVVGSSAISSFGSHASASAISTRWRCPPDSWCGYDAAPTRRECRPARATRRCGGGLCARRRVEWRWIASSIWSPTRAPG